jgi:hypothetical protein
MDARETVSKSRLRTMRIVIKERTRRDLRKTARGASSPAKPALHIPDLLNILLAQALCSLSLSDAIRELPLQVASNEGRGSGGLR